MTVQRNHIIHSRAGTLEQPGISSLADVKRIAAQSQAANPKGGLVIHFHGGLVNARAGYATAERLSAKYSQAGTYPVFLVWESGLFETLKNNLRDIVRDEVFQELVKKCAEWVLKQLGGSSTTRGFGGAGVIDERKLRDDFDEWFAGRSARPPVPLHTPDIAPIASRAVEPDEDDLAARIEAELDNDDRFQQVMAGLYVSSGRGGSVTTRGGSAPAANVRVLVDGTALDELFHPAAPGATRAVFTWFKVAKFVAKVVVAVVKRHWNGRDHGLYTTIVEEVLRAAYVDRIGKVVWRMMKKDTADAFGNDPLCVGTALLDALSKLAEQGKSFSRITLIGHSTGAVYINEFIKHAVTKLPAAKFDVVFLAPANGFEDFASLVAKHGSKIANFRMFAMSDALEMNDQLIPIIYPRSLLYLVSGVLEGEADAPIMGMIRFIDDEEVFGGSEFAAVARVRMWLAESKSRTVWSIATGGSGLNSASRSHGDFDNDDITLESVGQLLRAGF